MKNEKQYNVPLTMNEMQYIANSLGAFFNMLAESKILMDPDRAVYLSTALGKMRKVTEEADKAPQIVLDLN